MATTKLKVLPLLASNELLRIPIPATSEQQAAIAAQVPQIPFHLRHARYVTYSIH